MRQFLNIFLMEEILLANALGLKTVLTLFNKLFFLNLSLLRFVNLIRVGNTLEGMSSRYVVAKLVDLFETFTTIFAFCIVLMRLFFLLDFFGLYTNFLNLLWTTILNLPLNDRAKHGLV